MALSYNTRIHFPLTGCIVADVRISIARYIQSRGFDDVCIIKLKVNMRKPRRDRFFKEIQIYIFVVSQNAIPQKPYLIKIYTSDAGQQDQHRLSATIVYYD